MQQMYISIWTDFLPIFRPLEASRGGKKVFQGYIWTKNPSSVIYLCFRGNSPPEKASQKVKRDHCLFRPKLGQCGHIEVELDSVKLARMRTLAGPVSIHICFCHLLSATGAIVNVDNIILKYYVNVKIEKNFWKD